MEIEKIDIHITNHSPGNADIHIRDTKGRVQKCLIPIQYLASILDANIIVNETLDYSMLHAFPDGYCDCYYGNKDNYMVCLKKPKHVGPYLYQNGSSIHAFLIPFPDTIFFWEVKKGTFSRGECYALRSNYLYRWPFANVYDNGTICWGGNSREIVSFSDSHNLTKLFLESGFNTHLYSKKNTTLGYDNIEDLIRFLQGKTEFSEEWLSPCRHEKKTYKDIFKKFCMQ